MLDFVLIWQGTRGSTMSLVSKTQVFNMTTDQARILFQAGSEIPGLPSSHEILPELDEELQDMSNFDLQGWSIIDLHKNLCSHMAFVTLPETNRASVP
jgi:hypothetical protein